MEIAYSAAVSSSTAAIIPVSAEITEASSLSSRTEKYRDSKGSSGETFGFPEDCFGSGRPDGCPFFPLPSRLPGSVSVDGLEFVDESDEEEAEPVSEPDGSGCVESPGFGSLPFESGSGFGNVPYGLPDLCNQKYS